MALTGASASTFSASATGNIDTDATSDVWTIDQDGNLLNTTNDVDKLTTMLIDLLIFVLGAIIA